MAKPTKKTKAIDGILDLMLGGKPGDDIRSNTIRCKTCLPLPMGCGLEVNVFRDECSEREYCITGFCRSCQDKMFI